MNGRQVQRPSREGVRQPPVALARAPPAVRAERKGPVVSAGAALRHAVLTAA